MPQWKTRLVTSFLVFVLPQWKTWSAIRSRPGPTASISWRTSSLCITKQTMRTTEDHRWPSAGLERERERELTFLFIPCPITFNILIHEYFTHVKKKNFKWHSNKSSIDYVCFLDWFCVKCGSVCVGVYLSRQFIIPWWCTDIYCIRYIYAWLVMFISQLDVRKAKPCWRRRQSFYMLGIYYIYSYR